MLSCLLHRVCATRLPPPASTSPALHLGCLYVFFVVERGRPCPGGRCCTLATVPEWVLFVIHCVAFLLHRVCATRPPPPASTSTVLHFEYLYLFVVVERGGCCPGVKCCTLPTVLVVGVIFYLLCLRVECPLHRACDPHPPLPVCTLDVLNLEYLSVFVVVERGGPCPGGRCCMLATVLVVGVMIFFLLCVRVEGLLHCVCDPGPPPPSSTLDVLHLGYL